MSTNTELATIFQEMADILALQGANSFRVSAHARVARELADLSTDVRTLVERGEDLTTYEGIGDKSAKKISEYLETGHITEHETLKAAVPAGLLAILAVPGLGPKTVRLMWEQAGVTDVASLRAQMDAGVIEQLPRMGAKTVENIRTALAFLETSADRVRLGAALPVAESMLTTLRAVPGVIEAAFAGSLRRGCETIGDIDLLVATTDPDAAGEAFRTMDGVVQVLAAGATKSAVRLGSGLQVDLRVVEEASYGAALLYFTGSKQHNVRLRERAVKRGLRLNEYGLFPDDGTHDEAPQRRGIAPVAARTEEEIYAAVDLPWIPPELREDRGEFTAALPDLITCDDIRAELHAHTTASDGRLSIEALVAEAKRRGYHTIAVTDHSRSSVLANGLDVERLRAHVDAIRAVDAKTKGIRVLAGAEVDILVDGDLDYDDETLAMLDLVVASPHVSLKQDRAKATARILAAVRHPLVHIIGHPTGRFVGRREGLDLDLDVIIAAAVEHDTALEINANNVRLDLRDTHVRAAVEAGALIAINTDAHGAEHFDELRYGVLTGRRGWLTADRCVNAWPARRLHDWIAAKRP
ncbi:MAG: DNA polymerase/3'-5' exonuclease PolX [Phycisphaerales bacterium]|nr:DNA polymerase/3'-5' exonuclease PolX [Phycisphaerales bacterium]